MKNNIRIFLSSTFRDMQKERDYLVKKVFPALREIAEERGIPFSWCDLRFGVSSFEEENIIRLCLKNIENSSPCFVGLLGENYGSIPQNLDKKQIKRLSVFHGVPSMIKRKYGYTEIEMRYFISQKDKTDYFDFYFFIGEFNLNNHKFGDWKYILTHPISIITSLSRNTQEDKLTSWKRFVFTKSSQIAPVYWFFNENEPIADNIIYQSIKSTLESRFPIQQFPKEELIWNEQQVYMQSLISKMFQLKNIEKDIRYNTSKDILNLYSPIATGKTIYVANLLKKSSAKGSVCFYYFIGASRNLDTPLNIWKCILYQVCKYRNLDYGLYNHINDMEELRKVITLLIHQISKDVLVAIDGFGDDVTCSLEHKNTLVSDFPDPQHNIRYILTSSHKLSETSRVLSVEHKLSNNIIEEFIIKYLRCYYGYSKHNQLIPLQFQPKNLREVRYCIDETLTNTLPNNAFNNKETVSQNNVYECLKSRIISSINRQCNFYEGDKQIFIAAINNAIQVLSLTKYGILESDICNICNINAEQWTIIYSYLSPFFKSNGCIKLHESVAERFSPTDYCEDIRIQFIENLKKHNRNAQYTPEILCQASQLKSKRLLCEILSDIEMLSNLYETDKDLLAEYLLVIDKACLIKDFEHLLEISLDNKPKAELISFLNRIINIFHKVLPRYEVVLHFIDITNKHINENPITIEHQLEYNVQKTNIYIEIGKFNEALELIQMSDRIINAHSIDSRQIEQYIVKNLLLKAKLYHNDLQESNEKIKSLEIYREIIDNHKDNLDIDIALNVLDNYVMLKKNGEDVWKYINIFTSIFSNKQIVKENSHLYSKYAVKQIVHAIFNRRLEAESKEADDLFAALFCKLDESLQLYPYSHDNCYNMFFIFELLFVRVNKLYNKNLYDKCKENVITLKTWVTKFVTLSDLIYNKESIGYANAMFLSSRLYGELAYILPLDKDDCLNKSIIYSIEAEETFKRIYQRDNIITAKLYHNRAFIYSRLSDFKNAALCINKAIDMKNELLLSKDDSLFNSKLRRISMLIEQIIYADDINNFVSETELCRIYLNELKNETINNAELIEQKRNDRIIHIDEIERKYNLYINEPQERYLEVARRAFEESKRVLKSIQYQIRETDKLNREAFKDDFIVLVKRAMDIESYLKNHELHQMFYERCNDYIDFEDLFINIGSILKQ